MAACWALALAPAASASPVLVVEPERVRTVDDPYLPSRPRTDLPPPPRPPSRALPARRSASAAQRDRPTVEAVLLQALLGGLIVPEAHDRFLALYDESLAVRGRLSGARRAELASVISTLERIAASGQLTPSRMVPLFLTLEQNTAFWRARPFPAPGTRLTFAPSPVVFQYYPGEGLQIQPLANFGKANALYNACVGRPGSRCRAGALRELLEAMAALAVPRGAFMAWEYYFDFGGGSSPWTSGLSQGTAIQALARGSVLLAEPRYLELARAGLGAFEQPPPLGVQVPADGGNHYLIYSFAPRLRVLNGFLHAVTGLYDFTRIDPDPRAQALFAAGDVAARAAVPRHDTGAWSLYAYPGRESTLSYHLLVRDFLENLCERTGAPVYCDTGRRFTRYVYEHPRLQLLRARRPAPARRAVRIRFRLSKLSRVSMRVSLGGRTVLVRGGSFGYGVRYFWFAPRRPGRYLVTLEAADQRGQRRVARGALTVARGRS